MSVDLRTRYLGFELQHPIVASASPLTSSIDNLKRLQAAGVAAVVLPWLPGCEQYAQPPPYAWLKCQLPSSR